MEIFNFLNLGKKKVYKIENLGNLKTSYRSFQKGRVKERNDIAPYRDIEYYRFIYKLCLLS